MDKILKTTLIAVVILLGNVTYTSAADLNADGLKFGGVAPAAGVTVNVPATIQRGNVVNVSASYAPLRVPLNASCILVLPVNSPAYQEVLVYSRKFTAVGVTAHGCPMYIPPLVQIQGTALVIVIVEGAGTGVATFNVTP